MFCRLSRRPEFVRSVGGAAAAISCVLAGVRRALLSLMAIGGVTPSDSGAASRFAAADRPFVCLSPPFVSFILANTPLSNPLCLPRVFIPPPPPPLLPEPCPRLTLPGLNCFRCPFGSGTAGAAAERRTPPPPLSPPLTASPLRPSQPHLLNDIVLFLHIFTVSGFIFFVSPNNSSPFPTRRSRSLREISGLRNYTTKHRRKRKKNHVSHFRAGQRGVDKRMFVLLSVQSDVTDR